MDALNGLDELWVPASFLRDVARRSGVAVPVHLIRIPVDTEAYRPGPCALPREAAPEGFDDSWTVFLYVGTWDERKRPDILVRAFCRAFQHSDRALLLLKSYAWGDPARDRGLLEDRLRRCRSGTAHVALVSDVLTEEAMVSLYRSATAFVTASRGEGYCLPAVQSMSCGKPVIAPGWSAFADYAAIPVRYQLAHVPAGVRLPGYGPEQRWAEADEEDLAARMRWVHEHREEAAKLGHAARQWVEQHASLDAVGRAARRRIVELAGSGKAGRGAEGPPGPERYPCTLAVLLGAGEEENVLPFLWPFRGWPGDVVVIDDTGNDEAAQRFVNAVVRMLGIAEDKVRVVRRPLKGDFGAARNAAHGAARGGWVLHADLDERWDPALTASLSQLLAQLEHEGKVACAFPRANLLDGVLANDLRDSEWTEAGLARAARGRAWPPRNADPQCRLLRREERWVGALHERPAAAGSPARVALAAEHWILHPKSLARQRRQDLLYRSLGQKEGMPHPEAEAAGEPAAPPTLRERVLSEAVARLPSGRLVVAETGTLRDSSPEARRTDGWSTWHLASLLARHGDPDSRLFSIDVSTKNVETSKRVVPRELHRWVTWVCGDSRQALSALKADQIDLLYLDSADDPALIQQEFEAAAPKLAPHAIVVVDDTGSYSAGPQGKGSLLIPACRERGWTVEERSDGAAKMAVLSRRPAEPGADAQPTEALRALLRDLGDVEGSLDMDEAQALFDYSRKAGEGVLEVGMCCGKSTIALAAGRKACRGSPVLTVDDGRGSAERRGGLPPEGTWPAALRNFERLGVRDYIVPVMRDSLSAWGELKAFTWSLVLLGGPHDRLSAVRDAALWLPRIRPGGLLLFHDHSPGGRPNVVSAGDAVASLMALEKTDQVGSIVVFRVHPEKWL